MQRMKLTLEYDGSQFAGFQRQANESIRTVQGVLEARLAVLLNEKIVIHGAGRTDGGVHARGQVAHMDTSRRITPERLRYALSRNLPPDLVVREVEAVDASFHARKCALGKWYSYHIFNGRPPHAIGHMYVTYEPQPINEDLLAEIIRPIVGRHDFRGFCGRGATVQTFERTIYRAEVMRDGDWLSFHFVGDGFLRKMVRNIVGSTLDVATGRKSADIVQQALTSGDRTKAGVTAPAQGLYLEAVFYDEEEFESAKQQDFDCLVGGPGRAFSESQTSCRSK